MFDRGNLVPFGRIGPDMDLTSLSRYDAVLAAVPVAFLLSVLAASAFDLPVRSALVAAAGLSLVAVSDGVFRRPPGTSRSDA